MPAMAAKGARTGLPYGVVAGGFGALLALGVAAAVVIYFGLIRYERVAAQHVPRDAALVVRLDVEQAIVYEPFRRHLLPLAERGRAATAGSAARVLEPRLERLKRHTGIELAVDMRELLVAFAPAPQHWLIVIGGKFPKQGVVQGLHALLLEEGIVAQLLDEHRVTLANGAALGQAEDGALLFASSRAWLDAALPAQDAPEELAVSGRQAAALAAGARGVEVLPQIWPAFEPTLPAELRIQQLHAEVALGAVPSLLARVRLAPGADTATAKARLSAVIAGAQASPAGPGQTKSSERSGLEGLAIQDASEAELRIQGPWPRENLDLALRSFGLWLGKAVTP